MNRDAHEFTNALINETSPYLLQHAHNPVEWYPWGAEALSKAKREDKPILLSIGYSACHWCHVMAHESFEDETTAALMNREFVNIKVDREERPDLDAIYMSAVQLTTGSGGWPMTVFLTPDQVPLYCGTYFPPLDRYGMPSFRRVIVGVAKAYHEKRQILGVDSNALVQAMQHMNEMAADPIPFDSAILDRAASALASNYDSRTGGFGRAPKFPPSMILSFFMRTYSRTGEARYLDMVSETLTRMACGGIYDQLGGGFHRYSVDAEWLVPHFEKMLYDNALLSRAYLDAFLLTGDDFFRRIATETLDYVLREMTSTDGGFYSSQDADSEAKEGEFFLWTLEEVESIIGGKEAALFSSYFSVTPDGNFEGRNILNVPRSAGVVARLNGITESELRDAIQRARKQLFNVRERRIKPGRDEKILTAWNGLMLRSFAEAAQALDRDDYRDAAIRNAKFLLSHLRRDRQLLRSYKDGQAKFNGYLDDYAFLLDGLISLYEATFDPRWIGEALLIADTMVEKFWDPEAKNFFFTSADHEALIHRPKELFDNATPSGNSVAVHALLRVSKLAGNSGLGENAIAVLAKMASLLDQQSSAFPHLLCALDFCLGRPQEIAVIGDPDDVTTKALLRIICGTYLPNKVVACGMDGTGVPLLQGRTQMNGLPTVYICENFVCALPVTRGEDLLKRLKGQKGSSSL
jgi:uncharacterized protein